MDIQREKIKELLDKLKSGDVTSEEAITYLTTLPYEDVGFAKLDHHRTLRKGFPEVVLGQGKTASQILTLTNAVLDRSDRVLATRIGRDVFDEVKDSIPDAEYYDTARLLVVDRREHNQHIPGVVVASGGTSDEFVAQEAAVTAELMDCEVVRLVDVGVAGIHRLFDNLEVLQQARVVIAVAGMEGALPSVIGGLVKAPVIAVPTSIGYGSSFNGIAALLAMLNSCAPGVAVVNIDNGFGAGYMAATIAEAISKGSRN